MSRPAGSVPRDLGPTVVLLAILLAVGSIAPSAYRYHPEQDTTAKKLIRTLYKRGLNQEALDSQMTGYYEGLLDEAAAVTRVTGRGWFDLRRLRERRPDRDTPETRVTNRRSRSDFLRYDLPPNVDLADYAHPELRLVTNSFGMADREYTLEKPPRTWRIALVGDSIARGMGTPPGTSFEALLEDRLNEQHVNGAFERYEILNFAVQGYQMTQMVDLFLERVPPFQPDAYLVTLTERSLFRQWAEHLSALVRSRADLKYPFLRTIVEESGVTPQHSEGLIHARLARYRSRVLRWALEEMKADASRRGAELVVLLVPSADDPEILIDQFRGVKALLDELDVTYVDLLDTFAYLPDLAPVRVSAADRHPNRRGHQMLFEALYDGIRGRPDLRRAFPGIGAPVASGSEVK
jgi:hypothetical protein